MKLFPSDWRRQADPIPTPTRINLGPLTTLFVPPPYCSRAALAANRKEGIQGQSCAAVSSGATTATAEDDTGCWPRATAYPEAAQKSALKGMGFYSPGVMCPTGYYSACTAVSTSAGQKTGAAPKVTGKFQFPLVAGETAVGCCPTGYTCGANGGAQTCHQVATSTSFDAMTCEGLSGINLDAFQVPMTMAGETVMTVDLWAPMVQINHMATDLPESSTTAEASSRTRSSGTVKSTPTKTSASASATETDGVARVKDVNTVESSSKATAETSSSKASKTASGAEKSHESTITTASEATPTPTIDPNTIMGVPDVVNRPPVPESVVFDSGETPSMASSLFPDATGTGSPTLTADSARPTASPQGSFSTGAKVGVACAPLAGAALILLGVFYYKRRKQNRENYQEGDAKSISSDSSGPSVHQNTYFGGAAAPVDNSVNNVEAFPPPVHNNSPYNEDHYDHEMVMNGPGPDVIAPSGYESDADANKMTPADFYANPWSENEYETRPPLTAASRFKAKHARTLTEESAHIESPIDGASPFRLQRGNTLKGREQRLTGLDNDKHVSVEAEIVTPGRNRSNSDESSRTSRGNVEWGEKETLQRSNSYSKLRPRPKTAASSVYPDDRDSIVSWNMAMAPDMPDKPLPSIPEKGLDRSKSFSRPRPKKEESEEALVEGRPMTPVPPGVVPPPVTAEGVSF